MLTLYSFYSMFYTRLCTRVFPPPPTMLVSVLYSALLCSINTFGLHIDRHPSCASFAHWGCKSQRVTPRMTKVTIRLSSKHLYLDQFSGAIPMQRSCMGAWGLGPYLSPRSGIGMPARKVLPLSFRNMRLRLSSEPFAAVAPGSFRFVRMGCVLHSVCYTSYLNKSPLHTPGQVFSTFTQKDPSFFFFR